MMTKLRSWAEGVLEASVLLAVVAVPLLLNAYSYSVFERDKAALLVALGAVAAVALIVVAGERGLTGISAAVRKPLVLIPLLVLITTLLAALLSPDGRIAWLGSYQRAEGVLTLLVSLAIFAAAAWAARDLDARHRIAAAVVAASAPVSFIAVAQSLGASILPGAAEAERVFGTLSNPIFLGTYLMLSALLGTALLARSIRERWYLIAAGWAGVLILNLWALAASDSRGPLLGLGFGLITAVALAAAVQRRRSWLMGIVGLTLVALVLAAVFNMPSSPLAGLRSVPGIGRLGQIADTAVGSQRTRMSIWGAANRLEATTAREDPLALVVGHGPESLKYEILPHVSVETGGQQQADRLVDRAHNVLLDDLVMTGVLGALARVLMLVAWFAAAAYAAGLRGRRSTVILFGLPLAGLVVAGAAAGAMVPSVTAVSAMLGLAVGMLAAVLVLGWSQEPGRTRFLALGLAACAAGATVEAAFGIRTVAPDTIVWVLVGLTAALAVGSGGDGEARLPRASTPASPATSQEKEVAVTIRWSGGGAGVGAAFGLAAFLPIYALLANASGARPEDAAPVALLAAIVAIGAGCLAAAAACVSPVIAGVMAVVVLVGLLIVRVTALAAGDPSTLFAVLVWAVVALALIAGWWLRTSVPVKARAVRGVWFMAYALPAVIAVAVIQIASIRPVYADILFQRAYQEMAIALQTDDSARFAQGQALFDRVAVMSPHEPSYFLSWGELYAVAAERSISQVEAAAAAFGKAQEYAGLAEAAEPRLPYHAYNRGHVQLLFANILPPETRGPVAANAAEALQTAFNGAPTDTQIGLELATARLMAGDVAKAREMIEYVLKLSPTYPAAWIALGRIHEAAGDMAAAAQAYEKAIEFEKTPLAEPRLALGELARREDRLSDALSWYEQAAQVTPDDWAVAYNLGLLYRDLGDTNQAMTEMSRAIGLAPAEEQQRIQDALDSVIRGGG